MQFYKVLLLLAMTSSGAQAEGNYITSSHDNDCATKGTGCRLGPEDLSTVDQISTKQNFHAQFTVSYQFTCTPSGVKFPSRISLYSTDDLGSRKALSYDAAESITVEGMGPLRLEDSDPQELADNGQPPGCGLAIQVTAIKPSDWQVADWAASRSGIVNNLAAVKSFYDSRPTLLFWRAEYSAHPDQFRGVIEGRIASLKAELTAPCDAAADGGLGSFGDFVTCELIQDYQDVLSNAPDSQASAVVARVKAAATPIVQRGRKLVSDKRAAGVGDDSELTQTLDSITTLMGP